MHRVGGQADAAAQCHVGAAGHRVGPGQGLAHGIGQLTRAGQVGVHQHQEFNAAHAGQLGVGPGQLLQAAGGLGNQQVGLQVAIAVVHRLQVVQVDQQQAQRAAFAVAAVHGSVQRLAHPVASQQAGHRGGAGARTPLPRQAAQQQAALPQQHAQRQCQAGQQHHQGRQRPAGQAFRVQPRRHAVISADHRLT